MLLIRRALETYVPPHSVTPLCNNDTFRAELLWFLNTSTLQYYHFKLIAEYPGGNTFFLTCCRNGRVPHSNSVSSLEQSILSQMLVKADCMNKCWISYTCGNASGPGEYLHIKETAIAQAFPNGLKVKMLPCFLIFV